MDKNTQQKAASPIMRVMGNMHFFHKFAIVSVLFGIATLFSLFFMISSQVSEIQTATRQLTGVRYLERIEPIVEGIFKHRQMVAQYHAGKTTLKSEILALQTQINARFRELVEIDKNFEGSLYTSTSNLQFYDLPNVKPEEIENDWGQLARSSLELPLSASNQSHYNLIDQLLTLLAYVSDQGGLELASDSEIYFMMRNLSINLPKAQSLVAAISFFEPNQENQDDPLQLISLITYLRQNIDSTRSSLEKLYIYNDNTRLENALREPLRQYLNSINDYVNLVYKSVLTGNSVDVNELELIGEKTVADNFVLWSSIANEASILLQNKISKLKFQLYWRSSLAILMTFLAFFFGAHVLREAMRPIGSLLKATRELAEGNLSTRIPIVYNDTIGEVSEAINSVAESFQALINQLQWTGIQLTTSTTQIAAAAKQQESTVIQQEATTKEIAVTAREISATAKDFARTMSEVSKTAEQTSSNASDGKQALEQMQSIMHQLVDASSSISTRLGALNDKAGTITGVVTTITKVADQTNLLSLNAAIEAEKAGEHGRSFAVIAREIRRLADQTANATYDIEKMVTEMVSAVSAGVMGVDKFTAEINNAVEQVNKVSEHLTQIIEQVQQQTASFESVNQGMQAQSLGAEQINESIIQLSEVAQQTADSIRQFHRAVEQLNNAAQEMQNSVVKVKT